MARTRADQPGQIAGFRSGEREDPRVTAVFGVLGGGRVPEVASRWDVDPDLLARWVQAFVEAGTAQVTHSPVGDRAHERDRFLSVFLHDLRTPLAVAQGWASELADLLPGDAATADVLGRLQSALDTLDDRTLDVELLTAAILGRLTLERTHVAVADIVADIAPAEVVAALDPRLEVTVDPVLFGRVLRDLWAAATCSRPTPRTVRLEVVTAPPWVELCVVREGAPMDTRTLSSLFEPFDSDHDVVGVTVGLYLARALTVVHGGTLGVDQDEHRTRFWVRVPDVRLDHQTAGTGLEGSDLKFQLACGDVMPGCAARFEDGDEEVLLGQVTTHAASEHGIPLITPEILAAVTAKIRRFD